MSISFRAHCAKDHDRVDFTDPAAFEAHMMGEHGARKPYAGASTYPGEPTAPGWRGGKMLPAHPHKAPKAPRDTRKLTETLVKWQDESWPTPSRWYGPYGPSHVIGANWETAESTPRTFTDSERVA